MGPWDLIDHLVMGHRRLAADEVALVLWVQDRGVDVVAGEGPDRVDGVPQRQGDELGPVEGNPPTATRVDARL
jgi:hypothetical protein